MTVTGRMKGTNNTSIVLGILFLIVIIIAAGSLGFYSIFKATGDSKDYIDGVDFAREAQAQMQKQFQAWKTTVMEGENPEVYRRENFAFSRYAASVQDLLFNLKMTASGFPGAPEKIARLSARHNAISLEYIMLLARLGESNFTNKSAIVVRAGGKDGEILNGIDDIVRIIKAGSDEKISEINTYYLNILLAAMAVLVLTASVFSFIWARTIIKGRWNLEKNIRAKTRDLVEAGKKIRFSEEKYRRIVEGSKEIVFTLDGSWNIVTMNEAVREHFRIGPEALRGRSFLDLVHPGGGGEGLARELVRKKLELFAGGSGPAQFEVDFMWPHFRESKAMTVRLEYVDIDGEREIIGRAAVPEEAPLVSCTVRERLTLEIGNSLLAAEDAALRLSAPLARRLDSGRARLVRMALREMMINAIEHGNLNISFSEKTEALTNNSYFELIASRQTDALCRHKKVTIDYSLDPHKFVCFITDEGPGFDHAGILGRPIDYTNSDLIPNGRGIHLARDIFDRVTYNNKGNQVMLVLDLVS
jgi:PAS domain-containing protein